MSSRSRSQSLPSILITGACGEMGRALLACLPATEARIVTLDTQPLTFGHTHDGAHIIGSVTDAALIEQVLTTHEVGEVIHLAALLSTRSEQNPARAHQVNVEGTHVVLEAASRQSERRASRVRVIYPSSIAVYGVPSDKHLVAPALEEEWNLPITMYGCNKLYGEHLGRYYARHYRLLAEIRPRVDFRALRFPGLISATTRPTGGTSDYAPEMLHAAASGTPCVSYVRPDTEIPFMTMSDAVEALLRLRAAPAERLKQAAYNVSAFSATAQQIWKVIAAAFPGAAISWCPDVRRQRILDSWPRDLDCAAAQRDWGFAPRFGFPAAFDQHLIPEIRRQYRHALEKDPTPV